jgi:hypothetical protein
VTGPSDPNSYGFFGRGYWGRRVFWLNVPTQQRVLDEKQGGLLEGLLKTWGDEMESFLEQIAALPSQRDPYLVRAKEGEQEWFYVTEIFTYEDPCWGKVTRLIGEKDYTLMPETDEDNPPSPTESVLEEWFPWFPYAPISKTARWWKTKYGDAEYEVVRVRTRSLDWPGQYDSSFSQANEVWVQGGDLTVLFDNLTDADWTDVGIGNGTDVPVVELPVVPIRLEENDTPSPTPWLTANAKLQIRVWLQTGPTELILYDVPTGVGNMGDLCPESGTPGEIDHTTVYGAVNYLSGEITLDLSGTGDVSEDGTEIGAKWITRGMYFEFYPPRLIDYFSQDFGFNNDLNDPEDVQRSSIANVTKYFGLKSSWDSYRIRGEVSLFNVNALSLWRVCDYAGWSNLSPEHRFEYNGQYYTDIDPRFIHFDDISADIQFYDPDTSAYEVILDDAWICPDSSVDGYSRALAFALDVVQGYYHPTRNPATIVSSTALTAAELLSYGLINGYRVVVSMTQEQFDEFTFRAGRFGLTEYDKAGAVPPALDNTVFWIDREDESTYTHGWNPGALEWTIILGVATGASNPFPSPYGQDVAIRYWPEIQVGDCCFCPASRIRIEVEATSEAEEFYDTATLLVDAVDRLKPKLVNKLVPIHVVEVDYVYKVEQILEDVAAGATREHVFEGGEFDGATKVALTLQQRGDLESPGETQSFEILDENDVVVFSAGPSQSGYDDPTTWYDVSPYVEYDLTAELAGPSHTKVTIRASATATVANGDVNWIFKLSR